MQERYDKKKMKDQEKEMKGKAKEEVERRRKRVEENRQRREENRKKAEVLQKVSTDTLHSVRGTNKCLLGSVAHVPDVTAALQPI